MSNTASPGVAITISGLNKCFGEKVAVSNLNLSVPRGSFYGLLGPNGAGKSTTLSIMVGLLRPDSGAVTIAGVDVLSDPVSLKKRIGVVPETLLLFERLSGAELLEYIGLLRGLDPAVIRTRSTELLDVLDLTEAAGKFVVDYSQGMRKKISLAAALMHGPEVLLLDEPFESVDPVSVRTIKQVLRELVSVGGTVVFSSHVMETVEDLCDHVSIMNHGHAVRSGTLTEVRGGRRLEQVFAEVVGAEVLTGGQLSWLRQRSSGD